MAAVGLVVVGMGEVDKGRVGEVAGEVTVTVVAGGGGDGGDGGGDGGLKSLVEGVEGKGWRRSLTSSKQWLLTMCMDRTNGPRRGGGGEGGSEVTVETTMAVAVMAVAVMAVAVMAVMAVAVMAVAVMAVAVMAVAVMAMAMAVVDMVEVGMGGLGVVGVRLGRIDHLVQHLQHLSSTFCIMTVGEHAAVNTRQALVAEIVDLGPTGTLLGAHGSVLLPQPAPSNERIAKLSAEKNYRSNELEAEAPILHLQSNAQSTDGHKILQQEKLHLQVGN
ncbi:hypothetical protein CYMTET_26497 [Cymbomonas tetramitiformis]|uniref:Uncharacterized protein n=1 Tax=Cymbomonas tetramitiformis TaxID=36881 RepID=A0AAE0FRY0_9CHLO|nr:hypothetical protein CYMTET_26497 [Cymbomonas tetramitiformis]